MLSEGYACIVIHCLSSTLYIYIYIIISLFSHMVIHYVTHIKHVLKWYSSNVNKIMKKNNHL